MNRLRKFILSVLFCPAAPLCADNIHDYMDDEDNKAAAIVKEILDSPRQEPQLFHRLNSFTPRGPVFVEKAMALLAADHSVWKETGDKRRVILNRIMVWAEGSEQWHGFENSETKESIHRSAQRLLARFPQRTPKQTEITILFDRLNLWDETDLPFLMRRYFKSASSTRPKVATFHKLFGRATPEIKNSFVTRVREATPSKLLGYALMYQHGLYRDEDLMWLFKLLLAEYRKGRLFDEDSESWLVLNEVLSSLHSRLKEGDPAVHSIYRKLSTKGDYGALKKQFLDDLLSGNLIRDCEANMSLGEEIHDFS